MQLSEKVVQKTSFYEYEATFRVINMQYTAQFTVKNFAEKLAKC
jgi:hypothetical protein